MGTFSESNRREQFADEETGRDLPVRSGVSGPDVSAEFESPRQGADLSERLETLKQDSPEDPSRRIGKYRLRDVEEKVADGNRKTATVRLTI